MGCDESGTLGPRKHRGATQPSALLTAERVEDAGCRRQVGTAQQGTLQARLPVNVVAVIGAAPVAFEALLGGKNMISFLAKGLLVSWCTLVTDGVMMNGWSSLPDDGASSNSLAQSMCCQRQLD